jgi:hypothetical protein
MRVFVGAASGRRVGRRGMRVAPAGPRGCARRSLS